jgi:hypothetical protein
MSTTKCIHLIDILTTDNDQKQQIEDHFNGAI